MIVSCYYAYSDNFEFSYNDKYSTCVRPGLSDVLTTPHCLVSAFSKDDFPTFDRPNKQIHLSIKSS